MHLCEASPYRVSGTLPPPGLGDAARSCLALTAQRRHEAPDLNQTTPNQPKPRRFPNNPPPTPCIANSASASSTDIRLSHPLEFQSPPPCSETTTTTTRSHCKLQHGQPPTTPPPPPTSRARGPRSTHPLTTTTSAAPRKGGYSKSNMRQRQSSRAQSWWGSQARHMLCW